MTIWYDTFTTISPATRFHPLFLNLHPLVKLRPLVAADGEVSGLLEQSFNVDFAVLCFVASNIIVESVKEQFRVLWCHNDTRVNTCFRHTWQKARKIYNELCWRVRNNRKVRINSLSFFFAKFDIDVHWLLWVLIHIVHFKKSKNE